MTPTLGPDESLDLLCGSWSIFQLRRGHRFGTDDMICAWVAAQARPLATRCLDLGAGTGSVGLLTLHGLGPAAQLTMVEAQDISHGLARKTVAHNGLSARVALRHGDLRDPAMLPHNEHHNFDLVTGSPPYFPVGSALASPHPQKAACRMELRGDVFDYCRTAALALAPGGCFVLVHSAIDPRPEAAIAAAGLHLNSRLDVHFRRDRPPTIAVWTASKEAGRQDPPPLSVREPDGSWAPEWRQVRADSGAPDP